MAKGCSGTNTAWFGRWVGTSPTAVGSTDFVGAALIVGPPDGAFDVVGKPDGMSLGAEDGWFDAVGPEDGETVTLGLGVTVGKFVGLLDVVGTCDGIAEMTWGLSLGAPETTNVGLTDDSMLGN